MIISRKYWTRSKENKVPRLKDRGHKCYAEGSTHNPMTTFGLYYINNIPVFEENHSNNNSQHYSSIFTIIGYRDQLDETKSKIEKKLGVELEYYNLNPILEAIT